MEGMGSDYADSDTAFREQFDRSSAQYHGGTDVPVPIGGSRVPQSMPSEYAEPDPDAREFRPTDEYNQINELRNTLNDFKKEVSKICPSIEAKLRAKTSGNAGKIEQVMKIENERLQSLLSSLPSFAERILPHQQLLRVDYNEIIAAISEKALVEYDTKEEYAEFMFLVSQSTPKIFADMKTLLERLKKIKRDKNR